MYTTNAPVVITGDAATQIATQEAAVACGYSTLLTKYQCSMINPAGFDKFLYARAAISMLISESPASLPNESCLDSDQYATLVEYLLGMKGCCEIDPVLIVPELTSAGVPTVEYGT